MIAKAPQPMADLNRALASSDDAEAFAGFLRAARAGCPRAQSLVGWAYQTGRGVAVDYKQAADWHRKAACVGDRYAIANLGVASLHGLGAAADDIEAYTWLQSAAGLGLTNLRAPVAWLERRISGLGANDGESAPPVSPQTPARQPCIRLACDPSRCEAG